MENNSENGMNPWDKRRSPFTWIGIRGPINVIPLSIIFLLRGPRLRCFHGLIGPLLFPLFCSTFQSWEPRRSCRQLESRLLGWNRSESERQMLDDRFNIKIFHYFPIVSRGIIRWNYDPVCYALLKKKFFSLDTYELIIMIPTVYAIYGSTKLIKIVQIVI